MEGKGRNLVVGIFSHIDFDVLNMMVSLTQF